MRAKLSASFIGNVDSTFKNSDGEEIAYRQAMFAVLGEMEAPVFSIPKELDISMLRPGEVAHMVVDFRYNAQYKNFKGRVVALYPTDKALADADINVDGYVDAASYAASQRKA